MSEVFQKIENRADGFAGPVVVLQAVHDGYRYAFNDLAGPPDDFLLRGIAEIRKIKAENFNVPCIAQQQPLPPLKSQVPLISDQNF